MTTRSLQPPSTCQGILPPAMVESIVRNGSTEQRENALRTLGVDTTWRLVRATAPGRGRSGVLPVRRDTPQRTVADAASTETLPGTVVRAEGAEPTGDAAADEAYDGLGATFEFYLAVLGRQSIDDEGLPLEATVHYGAGYDNAFWNGERMVFGDGDGELFTRFTASLDVIGHELTHGVTQDEAGLRYSGQSGALNESLSDVFGSLVKQHVLGHTADEADWLIGADLLADGVQGRALRDMAHPGTAYDDPVLGKDAQPSHLDDYVFTAADNGGVHLNSGIPNRAFHAVATALGGYAWEVAGRVWYDALRDPMLRPGTGFTGFADATLRAARQRDPVVREAVTEGWRLVGVVD